MDRANTVGADGEKMMSLKAPALSGGAKFQARWVDRVKTAAIRRLHTTRKGELLLLRIYLIGEEATEQTLQQQLAPNPPQWLAAQVAQHLREEQEHVELFAAEIRARGAVLPAAGLKPDRISLRKIEKWHRLALQYAPRFEAGVLAPVYAIGMCAEQMAQRVLKRHREAVGEQHAFYPLLTRVLRDETRHVQMCASALQHMVLPQERAVLEALLAKVRRIDRSWGISGAVGLWLMGVVYQCGAMLSGDTVKAHASQD